MFREQSLNFPESLKQREVRFSGIDFKMAANFTSDTLAPSPHSWEFGQSSTLASLPKFTSWLAAAFPPLQGKNPVVWNSTVLFNDWPWDPPVLLCSLHYIIIKKAGNLLFSWSLTYQANNVLIPITKESDDDGDWNIFSSTTMKRRTTNQDSLC